MQFDPNSPVQGSHVTRLCRRKTRSEKSNQIDSDAKVNDASLKTLRAPTEKEKAASPKLSRAAPIDCGVCHQLQTIFAQNESIEGPIDLNKALNRTTDLRREDLTPDNLNMILGIFEMAIENERPIIMTRSVRQTLQLAFIAETRKVTKLIDNLHESGNYSI